MEGGCLYTCEAWHRAESASWQEGGSFKLEENNCCSFNQWKAVDLRHSYLKWLETWQVLALQCQIPTIYSFFLNEHVNHQLHPLP